MPSRAAHVDFRNDNNDGDGYVVPWYIPNPAQPTTQTNNGISAQSSYGLRTPTSSSSPTENPEHRPVFFNNNNNNDNNRQVPSHMAVPRPQSKTNMMDRPLGHHTEAAGLPANSQPGEMAFSSAMSSSAYGTELMPTGGYSSFSDDIFSANLDQAARHNMDDAFAHVPRAFNPWGMQGPFLSNGHTFAQAMAMHDAAGDDHTSEAIAMGNCAEQLRRDSQDNSPYGPSDQALIVRQPLAMHGANSNQSHYVNQLHACAEQMVQSPLQYAAGIADSFDQQDSPPEEMQHTFSQNSADLSQSPHSLADVQDVSLQTPSVTESRRPSTELVARIENVHLKNSQMVEDPVTQHSGSFKKPPNPSLAARRKQAGPHGINTQRPSVLGLNRVASTSAVHMSARNPTSPLHTLRRNKSSNVMYSGITKPGQSSNRASPRVASFSEASAMSSQVTPQPMNAGLHPQPSLLRPSVMSEHPGDMGPPSASSAAYTPGLYSGSLRDHSFQDTPITTPSLFGQSHAPYSSNVWPPPSGVPQSAPAHMTTFPRDLSPQHAIPSMPVTPGNGHFNQVQQQMQMYQGPMMQPMMVPSQHGPPEAFGFMPTSQHLFHQQFVDYPYPHELGGGIHSDRFLMETDQWWPANTQQPARALDVKMDANMDKLQHDIKVSRTKLQEISGTEIIFSNVSFHDMKIKADKS